MLDKFINFTGNVIDLGLAITGIGIGSYIAGIALKTLLPSKK